MYQFSSSEWLFYGGIVAMAAVVVIAILCCVIFTITGRKLKKRFEQEYGNPLR